jgi:ribosomal protein L3 glutamine methyltransferase
LTDVLSSVCDFIRYATSRFNAAGLSFSQGFDSALDEASYLVLTTLHLPHDLPPVYAAATLLPEERAELLERIDRRVNQRVPVAYLTGEAWFAGLAFKVSPDVLIPRSPIAELIERGFEPWLAGQPVARALDLCCGSGCIGIAMAVQMPETLVDLVDISPAAVALAAENAADHGVADRVDVITSDGFANLRGRHYDLIVSNPPYVGRAEYAALPAEFSHEPELALISGDDGLDLPLRILAQAAAHLSESGLLVLEVGASESALVECLPDVPFTWVEFERGGSGVAVLDRATLVDCGGQIALALAARETRA